LFDQLNKFFFAPTVELVFSMEQQKGVHVTKAAQPSPLLTLPLLSAMFSLPVFSSLSRSPPFPARETPRTHSHPGSAYHHHLSRKYQYSTPGHASGGHAGTQAVDAMVETHGSFHGVGLP